MEDNQDDDDNVYLSPKEILALERNKDNKAKRAVKNVLLPSLEGDAAKLGRKFVRLYGAEVLFSATEAVSLLLRRYVRQNPTHKIAMDRLGTISVNGQWVLNFRNLAFEVARFTDLWEDDKVPDEELQPAEDVFKIIGWMWEALEYQPYLFRHFVATPADGGHGDCFLLTEVPPKDRVDDPAERWALPVSENQGK